MGITAAIKLAVEEATGNERRGVEVLAAKIRPIVEQIRALRVSPEGDQKEFMDELWGEDENLR